MNFITIEKRYTMDNDKLLSSLSQHIAYWYITFKGEKDIVFPINNMIKERANQIFRDRYYEADVIISEKGEIYKISKEICYESEKWSYTFYLDDMKKNYHLKKICKEILPYNLKSNAEEKLEKIKKLNIPIKIITFKVNKDKIKEIKEAIYPYLKCFTYINRKNRIVIAYPDVLITKDNEIKILLNYYHHHHMEKHIKKITNAINKIQSGRKYSKELI